MTFSYVDSGCQPLDDLLGCLYTLLIPIFRFFIQPMSSKLFVSKERNSR
ncbi:MAG: hypothetical protein [Olavius algarvensis Gamma 1 endosymbiont]|nr:MAG: hypothetical protein [Olavius algarvensis Gamma 1 endosymbiont]